MSIYKPKKLNNDGSLEDVKFPLDCLDGSEDLTFSEIEISDEVTATSTNLVTGKGVYNAIKSANHGYVLEITASQSLNNIPYFTIPNLSTTDVANLAKAYTQQKPTFIHYVPTSSTPHYYRVDSANYDTSASSNFVAEVHIHVDIDLVKTIGESLCLEILYQSNGSKVSVRSNPNILYQPTAFFNGVNEDLPNLSGASITSIVNESIVGDITKIIGYDNNGYVETTDVISRGFNDTENWITFCWKNKIYKMAYRDSVVSAELLKTDGVKTVNGNLPDANGDVTLSLPDSGYLKPESGIPKSDLASDVQSSLNKADNAVLLTGDQTVSGVKTFNPPTNSSGTEQATVKFKTSNGGSIIFGKEGPNSGTMIRLDQSDGTCRLRFRSSSTAGAIVWEQPEDGAKLYFDLGNGNSKHRITMPSKQGTLALKSDIIQTDNNYTNADKAAVDSIGDLETLTTTDKSSLVNAINEVKNSSAGGGSSIDNKLDKTTYEWNKDIAFGGSGYLKIGSFPMYDTNITVEINATTNTTYHGTLVVATQNVSETSTGIACIEVYDDPTGVIANSIRIVRESGSRNFNIYFIPAAWSKNLIHIQALGLASDASDVCIKQNGTAPESTSGLTPVNKLSNIAYKNIDNNFSVSQTIQGNLNAVNIYASSDRRLKENIKDATIDSLDIISKIKIKEYNFIADQTKQKNIGIIAQELKEVLPEDLVGFYIQGKETETDHLSVNDSKLVYLLIKAFQEEKNKRIELEKRLLILEEKLNGLLS